MFKVIMESENYRTTRLYEAQIIKIDFVEDKRDREFDKIRIVKFWNRYIDPELIVIYRWEDEQLVENMIKIYKEME